MFDFQKKNELFVYIEYGGIDDDEGSSGVDGLSGLVEFVVAKRWFCRSRTDNLGFELIKTRKSNGFTFESNYFLHWIWWIFHSFFQIIDHDIELMNSADISIVRHFFF